ncbi:MAG: Gldg family protein [Gammaproteobacteria bacterium]|nr:Gldg family protein [Gammaproteobacteria bacterium]
MNTRLLSGGGLLLALVAFLAVNIIGNQTLTSMRLDVTENRLFTLSQGTRNILDSLREPINLRFFFSNKLLAGYPDLQTYGVRVRDLLEEYASRSGGQIKLTVIDPEPFSEAEDQAVAFGIRQLPVTEVGDMAYFGVVGTNSVDQEIAIPFFDPSQEQALEYDLTKLVYNLAHPKKRVVGVISGLPIFGTPDPYGRPAQPWTVVPVLREAFDLRELRTDLVSIDKDIDTLVVIHPQNLSEETQYAIDQFVLKGGKAMVFVDPSAENDSTAPDPANPTLLPEHKSDLPKLLKAWGLKLLEGKVAADTDAAIRVSYTGNRGPQEIEYLPWLHLEEKNLNREDFTTSQLKLINVGSSGVLQRLEGATTTITPLIETGSNSGLLDAEAVMIVRDPRGLLESFKPEGKPQMLAARVTGKVASAFPGGKVEKAGPDPAGQPAEGENAAKETITKPNHVEESAQPINVIVVADTDMLADSFWIRMQQSMGVRVPTPFADNGNFLVNAIDNLGGNSDLISLRSRGSSSRPFTVVEKIQKDAEAQFRSKERALQDRLQETEKKIAELQQQKDQSAGTLMSPQQKAEVEKFRAEMLNTRKQLRDVQHDLRKNIEGLGTRLRIVNIGLVPVLLGAFAIVFALMRRARRTTPATG